MNTAINSTIRKSATLNNTLLIGALWLVMAVFVMPEAMRQNSLYAKGAERIGGLLKYSPEEFYGIIGQYGDIGRHHFIAIELTADVFYGLVSSMFLCFLMVWSFHFSKHKRLKPNDPIRLALLTLLVFLLENAGMVSMLLTYPDSYKGLYYLTAAFSILKIVLIATSLGIIAWNLAMYGKLKRHVELSPAKQKTAVIDET